MQDVMKPTIKASHLFWTFFLTYAFLWTLAPSIMRFVTPMDATEGAMWAHTLQWGYPRDPWLNALLTKVALLISGNHDWSVYLFSQLMALIAFWSVWRLGRLIFKNDYLALFAAIILIAIQYYNLAIIDFNDNACELGLWPLMALYFYRSITTNRLKHWVLLGIISGLAMMAKYYTAVPLVAMLLFILFEKSLHRHLINWKLYISLTILIIICIPHIVWLINYGFITIHYSMDKVDSHIHESLLQRHFGYALHFFFAQIGTFMGAAALFLFGFAGKTQNKPTLNSKTNIGAFNAKFLFLVGFGPTLITVLISIIGGWNIHTMWGIPLLSLWSLILIALAKPILTTSKLKRLIAMASFITLLLLVGYSVSLSRSKTSSANYPAREIAQIVTNEWHQRYNTKLEYIAGFNKPISYITRYSKDHPMALIAFDPKLNPALDMHDLHQKGAVFILVPQMEGTTTFPKEVLAQYPDLVITPYQEIPWKRAKPNQQPMRFQIAFLPPKP